MIKVLQNLFFKRKRAYQQTFDPNNQFDRIVLADLRKFCVANGSKYAGDYEKTLLIIGRNQVWERINSYVNIPDNELAKIVEQLDE